LTETVQLQYFGSVRAAAGCAGEEISLARGISVLQLLQQRAEIKGEAFRGEVLSGEALRDDLAVSVNGAIIQHAAAEEIILQPGDTVALFPIFPGGG